MLGSPALSRLLSSIRHLPTSPFSPDLRSVLKPATDLITPVNGNPHAEPARGKFKILLLCLLLLMLALMGWQLQAEYQQQFEQQKQRSYAYGVQISGQLALEMELNTQIALEQLRQHALRPAPGEQGHALVTKLQKVFPNLLSLVWLNRQGGVMADSASDSSDADYMAQLPARSAEQAYFLNRGPLADSPLYMLLRQPREVRPGGFWVARLNPAAMQHYLLEHRWVDQLWQLEETGTQRLIARNPPQTDDTMFSGAETIRLRPLPRSDWQVRSLFDADAVRAQLLPGLLGKFLLFVTCALLALLSLMALQRELRRLQANNNAAQRQLDQAGKALQAIQERVILTDHSGLISYLNPQAEQLLALTSKQARGRHLYELLPGLNPLLLEVAAHGEQATEHLLELNDAGQPRLFSVSRSQLNARQASQGFVWVLRDVTSEQQARHNLQLTQRRYRDIFDGTGTGLCVLDLADLHAYLLALGLQDLEGLQQWLANHPRSHDALLQRLRISEINQMTQRLLDVESAEDAWQLLVGSTPLSDHGVRVQIISCLLTGQRHLEAESRVVTAQGHVRYLWVLMQLPELVEDYNAVTLSINDVTSRKRIELSLLEREKFWSDVVNTLPDTLYVHDIPGKRVMFSNNRLGSHLGYNKAELRQLGDKLWEKILHPDDQELYQRMRNLQQVVADGRLLECQLRWRHRDGSWHWFEIREQALSRDVNGRVGRLIGTAKDVTGEYEANERLRESERRYRLLAESTSDVIFSTNPQLNLNYVSPSIESVLGYDCDWVMSNGFFSTAASRGQMTPIYSLFKQVRQALHDPQLLNKLRSQLPPKRFLFDALRADGRKIPMELNLSLMWDEYGHFKGLLGVGRDISEQRQAVKELRMAATVFEHSTAAILVSDPAGYIVQVNEAFSRISGYSANEVIDQLPDRLTSEPPSSERMRFIREQLRHQRSWEGEVRLKRKDGDDYPAWVGITAIVDEEGDLVSYVAFFSDISERKASEQRIHRLAYYDGLTLLPNRTLFQDRLYNALLHAERNQQWVVLMFLDLDRFKPINDSLGHAAGDRMLKEVAQRLLGCVSEDDTVARMGGDEFTLLLQARSTREGALNQSIHVAEQILLSLAQPFILEGREFFISASIGIALSPQDGQELSQLMKNADTAMYHAKERGKNNFKFYQAEMNASALERLELESDLRHALEQGQFQLYYQPQFSGDGKRLTGAEALLRWQHPQRGLVAPGEFIGVLEELGLVVEVGDWVLAEACRQFMRWQQSDIRLPKISVNLSARQFATGQLDQRVAQTISASGIPPGALELELTESILMVDIEQALNTLARLKRLGVGIAIDDFGTGYSSLNYLKQFPIDVLKIDRSFVDGLPDGEQDAQIASAIIAMAHSLKLAVIAEGVETQAQLDFLRDHGCDEIQGYLLGKPMPAAQFTAQFSGTALFMLS
jgi:diguanylate cyclase (GGDEF)-like protein/PAS domain S-box-containing protein